MHHLVFYRIRADELLRGYIDETLVRHYTSDKTVQTLGFARETAAQTTKTVKST